MTMVTNTVSRRERKKAAVRSQIIAAAVDLFSRHGITDVTVDQIADAADTGKGTIYNYFQTKEDIVVGFMVELERKVQAELHRFTASNRPVDEVLAAFIRLQFRLKRPHHKFVRVFLSQMFLRTEQFFPHMVEMQKAIDPPLEALFRKLRDRGAMRGDVSLAEFVHMFKIMHLGLTAVWAIEGPPFHQTERRLKRVAKMFWEGVKAP